MQLAEIKSQCYKQTISGLPGCASRPLNSRQARVGVIMFNSLFSHLLETAVLMIHNVEASATNRIFTDVFYVVEQKGDYLVSLF